MGVDVDVPDVLAAAKKEAAKKTAEEKMAAMTPEELEEARASFEQLQALEKKREAENARVVKEKNRLQALANKQQSGSMTKDESDALLAEAQQLKTDLQNVKTADGKVP